MKQPSEHSLKYSSLALTLTVCVKQYFEDLEERITQLMNGRMNDKGVGRTAQAMLHCTGSVE